MSYVNQRFTYLLYFTYTHHVENLHHVRAVTIFGHQFTGIDSVRVSKFTHLCWLGESLLSVRAKRCIKNNKIKIQSFYTRQISAQYITPKPWTNVARVMEVILLLLHYYQCYYCSKVMNEKLFQNPVDIIMLMIRHLQVRQGKVLKESG